MDDDRTIPSGAAICLSGNDGYAEFDRDGVRQRIRVTRCNRDGTLLFNTGEKVDEPGEEDDP